MAFNYSPKIVTDGLVLYLDAANQRSYVSGSTTWNDLSRGGNNGTLTNGPTFSSANGGNIVFDGSNDYVLLPTNLFNHNAGTPFSVSFWFKTSVYQGIIFGQQNTITPNVASAYVPAIYIDTSGYLRTSCFWGNSVLNTSTSVGVVANGNWNNITVTFASNSHVSYLNGSSYAVLSKTQTTYSSTYYYFIGTGKANSWPGASVSPYFNGSIGYMSFYTRALSAIEILQNYNATKTRFGL